MSFRLTCSGFSSADDCDCGILGLNMFCGCSVLNFFVKCLELWMLISVVMVIFFVGSLED